MSDTQQTHSVECPATRDPAVRLFIVAAMFLGFGIYTIYDHYVLGNYPYPRPYELNPYLKYLFNHYIPYVLMPPGAFALVWGIRFLLRRLVADAEGIGYVGGTKVRWSDVTELDASILKSKQILCLRHGGGRKLVLDAWKLENFRDLVAVVEAHVPATANRIPPRPQ
jgi:hypothetical protein